MEFKVWLISLPFCALFAYGFTHFIRWIDDDIGAPPFKRVFIVAYTQFATSTYFEWVLGWHVALALLTGGVCALIAVYLTRSMI